jgi:hypothetical protein
MSQKIYSQEKLMDFIRNSARTGLINPSTALSRKKAAEQLLSQLDVAERQDLRLVDVDDLCSRFHKLQGSTIRPESLEIYRHRLEVALTDFIAWTDDPNLFSPIQRDFVGGAVKTSDRRTPTREEKAREELTLNLPDKPADIFPVPIRDDLVVYLHNVPLDLTEKEADKIVAVVKALADPDT